MLRSIKSVLRLPLPYVRSFSKASPAVSTTAPKLDSLSPAIRDFVKENVRLCQPDRVHVCDGSLEENERLLDKLQGEGRLVKLTKLDNCYLATTTKEDVARVERQTYICSKKREDAVPTPRPGVEPKLGYWKSPIEMDQELDDNFTGCMKGRTMYVIPFSMGPVGSPLAKYGIQLTDSEYVVASMRIMTRMGQHVLDKLGDGEFVKCLHSVGHPLKEGTKDVPWPCNPSKLKVAHFPERNEIKSFGSGYGGNSLLGKKCFALRIASILAHREGWLAEHMLILGLTNPEGVKKYIAAAFPSQCGKTNLAMITPTIPGWEANCVGDDIAWMKFGPDGRLRAINPEYGFFGVAPGTNNDSNPNAMACVDRDTIFTNVARMSDGDVYWEGLGEVPKNVSVTSWLGVENWEKLSPEEKKVHPSSHPNSRFCSPISNCPSMDPAWEDPQGVPIDAILFGGRRPKTIPLVYEARDWEHAVFMGATMRSEATSAAENRGKQILHDPFAMRPFFGYSFAQYMEHWLSIGARRDVVLPKIFHVNWFRRDEDGGFLWPGFSENSRVLEWIFNRCDDKPIARDSPLGLIPTEGSLNIAGLENINLEKLFDLPKDELETEVREIEKFFDEQLPGQVPARVMNQLSLLKERVSRL